MLVKFKTLENRLIKIAKDYRFCGIYAFKTNKSKKCNILLRKDLH